MTFDVVLDELVVAVPRPSRAHLVFLFCSEITTKITQEDTIIKAHYGLGEPQMTRVIYTSAILLSSIHTV